MLIYLLLSFITLTNGIRISGIFDNQTPQNITYIDCQTYSMVDELHQNISAYHKMRFTFGAWGEHTSGTCNYIFDDGQTVSLSWYADNRQRMEYYGIMADHNKYLLMIGIPYMYHPYYYIQER